jgi:hypothetical protein
MADFTIKFPAEDVGRFMSSIESLQKELGWSARGSFRMGGKAMLTSLASRTKVSQPHRDFVHKGESRSGKNQVYEVLTKYRTPKRKGKALRRSWQGPWRGQLIYAKNETELKQRRAMIIAMQGVAKESWAQAGKKGQIRITKKDEGNPRNARIMKKAARRWVEYKLRITEKEQYLQVTNTMRHIEQALIGGRAAASEALGKAASAVERTIINTIKRKQKQLEKL